MISNAKKSHYVLTQDLNRFMTNNRKDHGKNIFLNIAYNASAAQNIRKPHKKLSKNQSDKFSFIS